MITVESYLKHSFLQSYQRSLSETSFDDSNKVKMIDDIDDQIVDFDDVKTAFCGLYNQRNRALNSVDGLFYNKAQNRLVFVEFKNGKIGQKEKTELKTKLKDSLLMFTNIVGENLEFCRNYCEYILVYNSEKNNNTENSQDVSIEKGYSIFLSEMGKLAEKDIALFELGVLESVCVKVTHTYTVDEFRRYYEEYCH